MGVVEKLTAKFGHAPSKEEVEAYKAKKAAKKAAVAAAAAAATQPPTDKKAKKAAKKAAKNAEAAAAAAVAPPPPVAPPPATETGAAKQRAPSAYNLYMAQELARVKAAQPTLSHKEAFTLAASKWKDSKDNPKNGGTALVAAAAAAAAAAPAAGTKRKVADEDVKAAGRRPSPYNLYMAQEMPRVKAAQPKLTHKEAFTMVASGWGAHKENPKNGGTALVAAAAAAPMYPTSEAGTKRKRGAVPTDAMAVTYRKFCERTCDLLTDVLSDRPTSDEAIVDALRTSLNGDGDTFEARAATAARAECAAHAAIQLHSLTPRPLV